MAAGAEPPRSLGIRPTPGKRCAASALGAATLACCGAAFGAAETMQHELPASLDEWRVAAHVRFSQRLRNSLPASRYDHFFARVSDLGAHVLTVGIKTADEPPWWQSPRGPAEPAGQRLGSLGDLLAATRRHDLKVIAYVWISTDREMGQRHPDWICRTADGRDAIRHRARGEYLDITGPYREIILARLLELAEAGVDGFYFDSRHLPETGCWGTGLEAAFKKTHGPAPTRADHSELYARWLDFKARRVEETFSYLRDKLQSRFPDKAFIVSATTLPALTSREFRSSIASIAMTKTEYNNPIRPLGTQGLFEQTAVDGRDGRSVLGYVVGFGRLQPPARDVRLALGWNTVRDAGGGLPPITWSLGQPTVRDSMGYVASLLGHGSVAELDINEDLLLGSTPREPHTPLPAIATAFELGNKLSEALRHTRPLRWAAVHFAERARDTRWPDRRRAWVDVLWPMNAIYEILLRDRVPAGVITDQQLANPIDPAYGMLVLTNPDELTPQQQRSVAAFESAGGTVIRNDASWQWHDPAARGSAASALRARLKPVSGEVPVRVSGGPQRLHAVTHVSRGNAPERKVVVAIVNDFTEVRLVVDPDQPPTSAAPQAGPVTVWVAAALLDKTLGSGPFVAREAVEGRLLAVEKSGDGYRVTVRTPEYVAALVFSKRTIP